jgi:hypothetical protein
MASLCFPYLQIEEGFHFRKGHILSGMQDSSCRFDESVIVHHVLLTSCSCKLCRLRLRVKRSLG